MFERRPNLRKWLFCLFALSACHGATLATVGIGALVIVIASIGVAWALRNESFRARTFLVLTYLDPRLLARSVRLLIRNDTAAWYETLGDEVIEGMNEEFSDATKPLWLNIGFWKEARTYPDACAAMARELARAADLGTGNKVLDVGFGYGEQDILWAQEFGVNIVGLNVTPLHVKVARQRVENRGLSERVDLRLGSATELSFDEGCFDKVTALECAFHFRTRERFFEEALRVLRPGGRLALADMLPLPNAKSRLATSWFMRQRAGWPSENMYDRDVYCEKLRAVGYENVKCTSIRKYVYPGMYKHVMQRYARKNMAEITVRLTPEEIEQCSGVEMWESTMGIGDYVIVTADKPMPPATG